MLEYKILTESNGDHSVYENWPHSLLAITIDIYQRKFKKFASSLFECKNYAFINDQQLLLLF